MLGAYGEWAAGLVPDPPRLSFRRAEYTDVEAWRRVARRRYREALLQPDAGGVPRATVQHYMEYDGLAIEDITWQLPYGPPTEALLLKPRARRASLPAVLGCTTTAGTSISGGGRLPRSVNDPHPHDAASSALLRRRGVGKRVGQARLCGAGARCVHVRQPADAAGDLPAVINDLVEANPESRRRSNATIGSRAAMSISSPRVCSAQDTTWPGVFIGEDQRALDYLCSRPDVDPNRVGCGGLSGGGLRTVISHGAEERIDVRLLRGDDDDLARLSVE